MLNSMEFDDRGHATVFGIPMRKMWKHQFPIVNTSMKLDPVRVRSHVRIIFHGKMLIIL